jgi:hypothetical protein
MVVANRSEEEQRVLDASEAILKIVAASSDADFDPTELVNHVSKGRDRYSARAAVLHLLENGELELSSNWRVRMTKVEK